MGFVLRWIAILIGAFCLFSLAQSLYGFALAPVFKDALASYRWAFHPIADVIAGGLRWLLGLLHLRLPPIAPDAVILYVLSGLAMAGFAIPKLREREKGPLFFLEAIAFTLGLLAFGPPLLLLGVLTSFFAAGRDELTHWLAEFGKVATAFLILFGANGYFLG